MLCLQAGEEFENRRSRNLENIGKYIKKIEAKKIQRKCL